VPTRCRARARIFRQRSQFLAAILLFRIGIVPVHGIAPGSICLLIAALLSSWEIDGNCAVMASAAMRRLVCRMVLAWKKFQVSEALMLSR